MTIEQIIENIKTNQEWKELFEKAIYWEAERDKVDYVNNPHCTSEDIETFNLINETFLHHFNQIGIVASQYYEVKEQL